MTPMPSPPPPKHTPAHEGPRQNHLLAVLPEPLYERLLPHLTLVSLPLGEALYESGGSLTHVYFPTTSIVSLLYVMESGASAEIAVVGKEGLVGVAILLGGETMPNRAVVQSQGWAYRMKSEVFSSRSSTAPGPCIVCCCATPWPC